jgi:DNA polymerase-1
MLLQIHDELILESPEEELDSATELTIRVMEHVVELAVPLRVDVSTGNNLAEVKRISSPSTEVGEGDHERSEW